MNDLMTTLEVAKQLNVTPMCIYKWRQSGKLRSYKQGSHRVFKREDVERFLARQKQLELDDGPMNQRPRFQLVTALCSDDLRKMPAREKDFWEKVISQMNEDETKATCWAGVDKKTMEAQILKAAKRLGIRQPK